MNQKSAFKTTRQLYGQPLEKRYAPHVWTVFAVLVLGGVLWWFAPDIQRSFARGASVVRSVVLRVFNVQDVRLGGLSLTGEDDFWKTVQRFAGDNLENLGEADLKALGQKLSGLPWIQNVHIHKSLSGKVIFKVTEKKPIAWLGKPEGAPFAFSATTFMESESHWALDSKTSVFAKPARPLRLPFCFGPKACPSFPGLLKTLRSNAPWILENLSGAVRFRSGRWDLVLKNGLYVRLPSSNLKGALKGLTEFMNGVHVAPLKPGAAAPSRARSKALFGPKPGQRGNGQMNLYPPCTVDLRVSGQVALAPFDTDAFQALPNPVP